MKTAAALAGTAYVWREPVAEKACRVPEMQAGGVWAETAAPRRKATGSRNSSSRVLADHCCMGHPPVAENVLIVYLCSELNCTSRWTELEQEVGRHLRVRATCRQVFCSD